MRCSHGLVRTIHPYLFAVVAGAARFALRFSDEKNGLWLGLFLFFFCMQTTHILILSCKSTAYTLAIQSSVLDLQHTVPPKNLPNSSKLIRNFSEQVYNLHIVGGFEDDRGISEDLSLELLQAFTSEVGDVASALFFRL